MKKPKLWLLSLSVIAVTGLIVWLHSNECIGSKQSEKKEENKKGRQTGVEKQMSMWLWSKGYPNPTHLTEKYWQGWLQAQEIKKNNPSGNSNNTRVQSVPFGSWTSLGAVTNIGGRVVCIAIDPSNTNRLFIGTASGGIWKSTTGGEGANAWQYVPTGLPALGVSSILIHPANPNILYAGTGEVYRVDTSNIGYNIWKARGTYGVGILKSVNGGATWTQVFNKNMSQLFGIQMLKFHPTDKNIIYAAATDGLYRSNNAGVTWSNIFAKTYVCDVAINPSDPDQIVISAGNLVNPDKGIYRTTNGSNALPTFVEIGSNLPSTYSGYIRLDHAGSSRLYASVGRGAGNELYMSADFGVTWYAKNNSSHCGGQYWFAHDVAVDPADEDRVVMGGVSYYTYTSNDLTTGGTKSGFASGVHADVHDIKFDPSNSNIIYIACDGGMYKTENGSSFTNINGGLSASQFYASLAVSPANANIFIGGLQDNGVVKYNNGSWSSISGGDGGPSVFHPTNGQIILYSHDARAVFLSTDGGPNGDVNQKLNNLGYDYASPYDDRTGFMSPVAISKSNPNIMYVGSDNLHISTDGGASFQRPDPSNMTRAIDATYKPAIAMAVSATNYNKVYISTSPVSQRADNALNINTPARVLKSLNASNNTSYSFANVTGALPDRFVTDFAISATNDDNVFITLGGFGSTHIYVTSNGGAAWTPCGSGLPDVPFNAIIIDPVNPDIIYAGCDLGVYVSHNRGVNWYDFSNGFSDATLIMDLQISSGNKLIAATHGKGLFRSDLFTPPATLPVLFTSFTGNNRNNYNELKWNVALESRLSRYELERSPDGSTFQKIGDIIAKNSPTSASYAYHENIQTNPSSTYYYRLKAVNIDGTYHYSEIVFIKIDKKSEIKVIGNPFQSHLIIRYNQPVQNKIQVRMFDMKGKLLCINETTVVGYGNYIINDLAALSRGTYILEIVADKKRTVQKVMKQ